MDDYLLRVHDLRIALRQGDKVVYPVNGASFAIRRGETFALLGESGCGKSMTASAIMQLLPHAAICHAHSHILLDKQNLLTLSEVQMRHIRGRRIGMIFQEPMSAFNPVMTIAEQLKEVLKRHFSLTQQERYEEMLRLLDSVGIRDPKQCLSNYPHQLSGGMKQRVMIAIALAGKPDLLIADEPTTALDVTIQAQVLSLLKSMQEKNGMAILFITHDLAVAKQIAHEVGVMYAGHIVEQASSQHFFQKALHPYSQQLFNALPSLAKAKQSLHAIKGNVPPLGATFSGCRFADRCPSAWGTCHHSVPNWLLLQIDQGVRCHLYDPHVNQVWDEVTPFKPKTTSIESEQTVEPKKVLSVRELKVHFPIHHGLLKRVKGYVKAVDGISFDLYAGRTLALVGESGCGKTTSGQGIVQLLNPTSGEIYYHDRNMAALSRREQKSLRQKIQIIFQDPYSSMNPRMTVYDIIAEGIRAHRLLDEAACLQKVKTLLQQVGLSKDSLLRYPHEFSGGQRQRICIARALAVEPEIIICDEPTSALDVSVQAQILNLLRQLQTQYGLSYLFISHNMSVVAYLADEIAVMVGGKIVEHGTAEQVLNKPKHEYTQTLLDAVPQLDVANA